MIRLSIPLRQSLSRLSLPVLIALAFGTMLLGKADALLAERARMALADLLTPIWGALQEPVAAVRDTVREAGSLLMLRSENVRLREENERLRRWQSTALALEAASLVLRLVSSQQVWARHCCSQQQRLLHSVSFALQV